MNINWRLLKLLTFVLQSLQVDEQDACILVQGFSQSIEQEACIPVQGSSQLEDHETCIPA